MAFVERTEWRTRKEIMIVAETERDFFDSHLNRKVIIEMAFQRDEVEKFFPHRRHLETLEDDFGDVEESRKLILILWMLRDDDEADWWATECNMWSHSHVSSIDGNSEQIGFVRRCTKLLVWDFYVSLSSFIIIVIVFTVFPELAFHRNGLIALYIVRNILRKKETLSCGLSLKVFHNSCENASMYICHSSKSNEMRRRSFSLISAEFTESFLNPQYVGS